MDPDTNQFEGGQQRHADVYVFAVLAHRDKQTLDPLDLTQWEFYVLPTGVLDSRLRAQKTVSLKRLKELDAGPYDYRGLKAAVLGAGARPGPG